MEQFTLYQNWEHLSWSFNNKEEFTKWTREKGFPRQREQNGGMQEHGRVSGNPAARVVIL